MKPFFGLVLVLVGVALSISGCSQNVATTKAADSSVPQTFQASISPSEEYVIVNCLNNIEYFNAHKWAWIQAGKLFNVKTRFVGPMDGDTNAMAAAFESAVANKPAGICVWGWDPGLTQSVDKAIAAGIPVVTYVGDLKDSKRLTYIGTSQYQLGYDGAKKYAATIGGKGKVAILTLPGNPMFEERAKGFKDGFALSPEIKIVAVGDTKADPVAATSAAKAILNKAQDLKGFVCTDSTGAIGASTAVKEMGMTGKIDILGLDRNSDVLNMVKDGTITGTIVQNDASMPYWAMVSLITAKHINIGLTADDANAGVKVAPDFIYTSTNLVTKANVDLFLKQNETYSAK